MIGDSRMKDDKIRNIVKRLNDKFFDKLEEGCDENLSSGFSFFETGILSGISLGREVVLHNTDCGDYDDMLEEVDRKILEWSIAKQTLEEVLTKEDIACLNGEL
jgi:hypothetical protein